VSENRKTNGIVRRGKTWSIVIDLGDQLYRQCPTCRRRYWTRDGAVETCKRDGEALDAPRSGRRQQWLSGFRTRAEATDAANASRTEVRRGTFAAKTHETVSEFLGTWLDVATNLRATTREQYEITIRAYVAPRIGQMKLTDVTPDTLDSLYADLSERGGRGGRPLKPKTVKNVHVLLHRAFVSAVRKRKLTFNPADGCDGVPATERRQSREKRMRETVWSPVEIRAFLASVRDDRLYPAWLLLTTTGLRRGELLGLPWSAVSLTKGTIRIEQALVMLGGKPTVTETKSDASSAEIAIDATTIAALRDHRKAQSREIEAMTLDGLDYVASGLVFTEEDGSPIHPDRFLRAFKSAAKRANLRPIRIHDLRHSYASALLSADVPMKIISERLRHAGIGITADLYTHLAEDVDRAAAEQGAVFILGG
jgi:integrase